MSKTDSQLLSIATEIVKAYASSGGENPLDILLEDVYKKLVELNK